MHSHSWRLCCRGKGKLDKPCQLKDAACCLSFSAWADLECEGIGSLESGRHVLPASEIDMLGYTHPCPCLLVTLSFVHCPYLICCHHYAVHREFPVPILCHHCFCCPSSKGLTIIAWRVLRSTISYKRESLGSVPQMKGTVAHV